ncbi:hypothetical protein FOZ62_024844 [Perkinsus olseni]|uniref:Prolyl 4-hydroxylase alpha subunit Fe(2+) 2OG dioxygenase domain-containing protein n=1 Tax=Perkinsus olseni TaxID=32597 RepID=A0A7J6PR03_PEROL|nr:hypothetical protein FOZ62_024844 [Perkinsus olseni]
MFTSKLRIPLPVKEEEKILPEDVEFLQNVEDRIGQICQCPPHEGEVPLVTMLTPPSKQPANDGERRLHLGLHVDTNGNRPFRFCTAIIYLSDVSEGGETVFPVKSTSPELVMGAQMLLKSGVDHLDKVDEKSPEGIRVVADMLETATSAPDAFTVQARKGRLVLFYTRGDRGEIDPLSWHGGATVHCSGGKPAMKWTLQKFKEIPVDARESGERIRQWVHDNRDAVKKIYAVPK